MIERDQSWAGETGLASMVIAGPDDRMHSTRPKPVHLLCGRPMVQYVLDALGEVTTGRIVIVARSAASEVAKRLAAVSADPRVIVAEHRAVGDTGDAVGAGLRAFADDFNDDDLLVLRADMPLIGKASITELVAAHRRSHAAATVLTVPVDAAPLAARVMAGKDGTPVRLVAPDAPDGNGATTAAVGAFCFRRALLTPALRRVVADLDGMTSLDGVIEVLTDAGHAVATSPVVDPEEASVVDDRVQLAAVEAVIRHRTNRRWMARGVTMLDPARTYLDATVTLAPDVTIFPGTMLQGSTVVGSGAEIGPDTRLVDCAIGSGARVEMTMGRDAEVGADAHVGPFAVLEPGAHVFPAAVTGPFYHALADNPEDS